MILNETLVSSLEGKCNTLVCNECGNHHPVQLKWCGDVLIPCYPDGNTCLGFKEQVNALLNTEISRHIQDPFPLIR